MDQNLESLLNQRLLTLTTSLIDVLQRTSSAEWNRNKVTDVTAPVQPPRVYLAMMPRPGEPGVPFFDKVDVTDFLRHWNIECEDCGFSGRQKCERLWFYCSDEVRDIIEFFEGYRRKDWDLLEKELRDFFYRYDS